MFTHTQTNTHTLYIYVYITVVFKKRERISVLHPRIVLICAADTRAPSLGPRTLGYSKCVWLILITCFIWSLF